MDEVNSPQTSRRAHGTAARWAAGLGAVALLAGASVLGVTLSDGASGGTAQAARAALTASGARAAAGGQASGGGQGAPAMAGASGFASGWRHRGFRGARARLARLAFLARRAEHGEVTVATRNGPKTIAFERGIVQSATGSSVVVKAADGVTWTWQISSKTRVFAGGHLTGARAVAGGQRVAVAGLVSGGTDRARRVLIRPSS